MAIKKHASFGLPSEDLEFHDANCFIERQAAASANNQDFYRLLRALRFSKILATMIRAFATLKSVHERLHKWLNMRNNMRNARICLVVLPWLLVDSLVSDKVG